MAMSPSPQLSPIMGGANRIERHQSNSPPLQPQQLSKRDKRRTMLQDRLGDLTEQFSNNRDHHYRTQLQAMQIDMNLIMESKCNLKTVLPNTADEIDSLVKANIEKTMRNSVSEVPLRAGKLFADFAKDVNDAMEERDAALATHMRDFKVKLSEIATDHKYRTKLAQVEHQALSKTVRDRLINSVMARKTRLSKDKESIEIETSSALLLHPSQFGLANPASPGGIHGKRATRHRREVEDFLNYSESHKRKRKAHDSDESPAPHRQRIDNGSSTPSIYAEHRALVAKQIDSSIYSVDKLFTDKELAMNYNEAAMAAYQYILQHPPYIEDPQSPANGKSDTSSDEHHEKHRHVASLEPEHHHEGTHSPPNGAAMERTVSQAQHHTRASTRGYHNAGFGIEILPDIHYPGAFEAVIRTVPKLPPYSASLVPKTYLQSKHDPYASGGPAGLSVEDSQKEYETIKRASQYNSENGAGSNLEKEFGGKELLEVVSAEPTQDSVRHFVREITKGREIECSVRDDGAGDGMNGGEVEMGGIEMSRQTTGDSMMGRGSPAGMLTPSRRNRGLGAGSRSGYTPGRD